MNGNDLILVLQNSVSTLSNIGPIVAAIFTAIFLQKNTKDTEFEKLKAGKFQEVANHLLDCGKMTYTEYYKANNFLQVAKLADQVLKNDFVKKSDTNQKYDFDWFMRFYENVGNVSNEEMQLLWAKILAGEVHQSGTYSLQLLDILKNFTQKQAKLFYKVCDYCLVSGRHVFVPNYEDYLQYSNITYQDIFDLDSLGLMNSSGTIVLTCQLGLNKQFILCNDNLRMVVQYKDTENKPKDFTIAQFPFTPVGIELVTLIGKKASDTDFLSFVKSVSKANSKFSPFIIGCDRIFIKDNCMQFKEVDLDSNEINVKAE